MSLIQRAESDLAFIIENEDDFGWPVILRDPEGRKLENLPNGKKLLALLDDISSLFDPGTGQPISGRLINVTLRISTLLDNDFKIPEAVADGKSKPWLMRFSNVNGNAATFKVSRSEPDRMAGWVTCFLEYYREEKAF